MSRTSLRFVGTAAAGLLLVVPVVAAAPAGATSRPAPRSTVAMLFAEIVAESAQIGADMDGVDGRSIHTMRAAATEVTADFRADFGAGAMTVSGLSDRNRDGLDDDGRMNVRVLDNVGVVSMHRDSSYVIADGGFVFKNSRAVLKESAQSFDRTLRFWAGLAVSPTDAWDMTLIKDMKYDMPRGVRVVSDHDGNHDGYDDDGRLTFLARGKAVTLTIGNTPKQVGTVTYGPTWRTKAPNRVHHPVAPPTHDLVAAQRASRALTWR